ncbi:uncharacterized protein LOC130525702 isoform X2 [Takifugu flavidus]|uniref:uncharacterized protein LOC130525702 isoform X2 n=1 Tax=Takifugu flavidus TaxID=433684 RepID=UPI0025444FCB|nr:uncharacterized protein LOC130525702 isoform X2 [Takifugu flavidus]
MDSWCLATWMVLNFLCVFAYVTVRNTDLKSCEKDKQLCVIDPRDCDPRPPSAIQESLNMFCYYQIDQYSVTCNWSETFRSPTEPELSLIFRSVRIVYSCLGVFIPLSTLSITAKMKNFVMDTEIWSQPLTIRLHDAVKPSQPVLTVCGSTANSINVTWDSICEGDCRLRYRANGTQVWTEVADTVPAGEEDQILTYNIKGLLPFTVYGAAVACRGDSNIWSDWSSEVTVRTPDMIPSRPVEVCYTVEKNEPSGSFQLRLRWQDSNPCDPGSRVLAYQVSYKPEGNEQLPEIRNVTDMTDLLEVEPGNYSITVRAFNTAGYGPVAQLYIDTQRVNFLPPVRNLWVYSHFPAKNAVQVHWQNPSGPLVSHSYVQWYPEAHPSIGCWITVESWNSSALIEDIDPYTPYLISVIPVYGQQCGPSWSLPASLQHGALMEAVQMKLVGVTKKTVTVGWVWQRRSKPIRVGGYRAMLRRGSEMHPISLWPDQWQHTFSQLTPSTEYSLVLLADNVSKHTTSVQTSFDEVPVVAAATPLLLLAVVVFIFFLLFRTACKSYFFPTISSPWSSKMGHWLINPPPQKTLDMKVLDIEDYRVVDVLGDKGLILVVPRQERSSKKDLREDASPLMHTIKLDVCVSEFATKRENSANDDFLRRGGEEEEENAPNQFLEGLCQEWDFSEGMTNHNSHMTCETEYIFVEQISPPLKQ